MISIYSWFGMDIPTGDHYRLIKRAGFGGVLLWWSGNYGYDNYRSHPDFARNAGLLVENIHAPFELADDLWRDNLNGPEAQRILLNCIEDCAFFEIPAMVVHLTGVDNIPPPCITGLERVKALTAAAEDKGVNIALENIATGENLDYVFSRISSPRLGFCYDSGHHNVRSQEIDLLGKYGERLMALHLHDNCGTIDQHLLPFDGNIDWSNRMKRIAETGYKGATALEVGVWDKNEMSAEVFLAMAYQRAERLEKLRIAR